MKKIFTLFFALFTMAFFANAQQQVTVILEAHDVWGDGSGYQLLLDADHTAYGTVIPTSGALTSDANTTINYASTFEYTIPTNANGSASSTNVVVDGAVTITIPAGTYDFCVANPTPGDRIWIAAGENGRKDDYVFDPAFIYHFTVAMNGQNDGVTIEMTPNTTDPTIMVTPNTLSINAIVGNFSTDQILVSAYNLTAGITATTAAPFEVSADGTTYATTATIAQAGGPLYVKYTPTAAGTDNGTITLASTGAANVTVSLTGTAIDCSNNTIPYSYAFDNQAMADCWTITDANNDGKTFTIEEGYAQYTYNSSADADDWLISPVFNLTGAQYASIDYAAQSTTYPEKFQVFAINTSGNTPLTQIIDVTSTDYQTLMIDLTALNGNYSIGFHCVSDADQYYLKLTNFVVNDITGSSVSLDETALDFGIIPANTVSEVAPVVMTSVNLNEAVTFTAPTNFEVSTDGLIFSSTVTIPANSAMIVYDSVYVRFAPTAAGTFDGYVMVSSTSYTDSIYVEGEAVDCSQGITTLPFTYDFNTGLYPPICWTAIDEESYSAVTVDEETGDYAIAISNVDRLITPEIHATDPILLSFDFGTSEGEAYPTKFRIGYSSTDMTEASFTFLSEVTAGTWMDTYTTIIPAGTKYIAIDVTLMGSYTYWFWQVANSLYIDNFSLAAITEPMMMVSSTTVDMGSIELGSQSVKNVQVLTAMLTDNITVTAPANFEVSSDNGSTYAATATMPTTGGNLLIKFEPTTAGSHSGTISLTSGTATASVNVSGRADDCSSAFALPFSEDFEESLSACWINIDNDGDGYSWMSTADFNGNMSAHSGDNAYISESYNSAGALTPNNWLITPAINIPASGAHVGWWVAAQDADYPADHYEVKVSTGGTTPADFTTTIHTETLASDEWSQRSANLDAFTGQTVRIAFVHNNCTDMFIMKIDDIEVSEGYGINEVEEYLVSIYPNPTNSVINVNATSNISNVEVYTIAGQKVGNFTANSNNTSISTANLTSGLYLMRIHTENGVINKKFSVVR